MWGRVCDCVNLKNWGVCKFVPWAKYVLQHIGTHAFS
jgi:hypothetical protein